jgi:hypothetical protein
MNFRDVLGAVLVGAFIAVLGTLFFVPIPTTNEQLIVYMLGQLSGFVAGVVALHYVTKAGDKELDQARAENTGKAFEAIAAAAHTPPPSGEAPRSPLNEMPGSPAGTPDDPVAVQEVKP